MNELREISNCLRHIADNFEKLDEVINCNRSRIECLEAEIQRNEQFKKKLFNLLNEEING